MAKFSTGLRNYVNATGSVRQALADSEIRLFSGPPPSNSDAAIGGGNTLLCTINDSGSGFNFDTVSVGGVLTKDLTSVLQGNIVASGTATFYRHVLPADTDGYSDTLPRIQGSIGLVGTDMELSNTSLLSGGVQRLSSHSVVLTEE